MNDNNQNQVTNNQVQEEVKKIEKNTKQQEQMDKKDLICYIGAVIFFILALLPLLLRNFDLNYNPNRSNKTDDDNPTVTKVNVLKCNRTVHEEGYSYYVEVESAYSNSYVMNTTMTYEVTIDDAYNLTLEEIEIKEYASISSVESNGVGTNVEGNKYSIRLDYSLDESLRNNDLLSGHNKLLSEQRSNYEALEYNCIVE